MENDDADIDARLKRLLGGETLAPLRQRLRKHFERRAATNDNGDHLLRLNRLHPAEREALAQLIGRPVKHGSQSMQVNLAIIDHQLRRAGLAHSLHDALERLDGPIVSARAERQALNARWAESQTDVTPGSLLHRWLSRPESQRLLRRLARRPEEARHLLANADRVLQALPCPPQPRAQLAAKILGDAHALDNGRPIATLVLAAWRHHEEASQQLDAHGSSASLRLGHDHAAPCLTPSQQAIGFDGNDPDTTTAQANENLGERQRDIWARAGVLVNELARPALYLNLPVATSPPCRTPPGEPAYLSLRHLLRHPPAWDVAGRIVYVCENPNLLAIAADRLGEHCPPLVCTDGMPAAAQRNLLDQLQRAGAQLCYHGDFDWAGIQIANHILRRWHALPWRMRVEDYEAAAHQVPASSSRLVGDGVEACWDQQLLPAMQRLCVAIPEEALADSLMADLADPPLSGISGRSPSIWDWRR